MSSSNSAAAAATVQYKLEANSNAISLIADVAAAALPPSPSHADRIEWSRATILGFIEDYRRQRVLWDPNTKGYHIKQTKYEALKLLSQKYGTEIRSIRSKIKSLRSSFHREHGKVLNGRNRGVHYQPMWFAYEAIRFILDGERDLSLDPDVDDAADIAPELTLTATATATTEAAEKLALMHSLDLEQLTGGRGVGVGVSVGVNVGSVKQLELHAATPAEQQEEFAARVAAVVAAVAAASVNHLDAEAEAEAAEAAAAAASSAASNGCAGGIGIGSAAARASAAVTRSSSDLDGENYCNISAEDVKTEIIEHDSAELGMLGRRTSTPSPTNYYKPTDLTYNPRKRKAQMDENGSSDGGVGSGERVVGALTLTPIKQTSATTAQQMNHNQLALHALQQHFSHNLSHSHSSNGHQLHQHHAQQQLQLQQQQQQQQQQQHSSMAPQRDRDLSPAAGSNNNGNHNHNQSHSHSHSNNGSHNNHSSSSAGGSDNSSLAANSGASGSAVGVAASASSKPGSGGNVSGHVDEYGVFGEYVAITIRKLKTSKSKIVVKHLINNLLYEAELGKYDHGMPASKEPPQLYKMQ